MDIDISVNIPKEELFKDVMITPSINIKNKRQLKIVLTSLREQGQFSSEEIDRIMKIICEKYDIKE